MPRKLIPKSGPEFPGLSSLSEGSNTPSNIFIGLNYHIRHMVSSGTIRVTLGILGISHNCGDLLSVALLMSPVPTFFHICKKGSVEQFSPVPYLIGLLNYMLWLVYALPVVHPNSTLVLVLGVAGCLIEMVYLSLFVLHSNHNKQRLRLVAIVLGEILFVGLVTCLVLTLVHTNDNRSRIVGILADVASTLMYGSPLSVMKLVITTKSVEYMPFSLSLATFVNAIVWTVYGLFPFDPYFVAPCGLGAVLGLAQLVLYGIYFRPTKEEMSIDKTEMGHIEKNPSPFRSQNS